MTRAADSKKSDQLSYQSGELASHGKDRNGTKSI